MNEILRVLPTQDNRWQSGPQNSPSQTLMWDHASCCWTPTNNLQGLSPWRINSCHSEAAVFRHGFHRGMCAWRARALFHVVNHQNTGRIAGFRGGNNVYHRCKPKRNTIRWALKGSLASQMPLRTWRRNARQSCQRRDKIWTRH